MRFFAILALVLAPGPALGHASEQSFVLLLPTDVYIGAGVAAVALTVALFFFVPGRRAVSDAPPPDPVRPPERLEVGASLFSLALFAALIVLGLEGPRDPLANLLPLLFWTVGWMGLVSLSGIFGIPWRFLNPWTGLHRLIGPRPARALSERLGLWPATLLLIGFTAFLLADIAPDDPARLAVILSLYWVLTMAGVLVFGESWLKHVELGRAIFGTYAKLVVSVRRRPGYLAPQPAATGVFALTLLAAGSFDGLNETFWWLGVMGVNPLEFPGRSAVVWQTLGGLAAALVLLFAAFGATVWLGLRLIRSDLALPVAFERLALSLLPIALAYHIAHYLPSFLVGIQYVWAALSDPLNSGADLLGIGDFHVTTGFFNRLDTVRVVWLTQAGVVVLGHIEAVRMGHRIALDMLSDGRKAALATLPLSLFMIGYTFLGLWLLAAPRGA